MTELELYYNKFNEDKRLIRRHGQVEFITSLKYIHEVLNEDFSKKILDIGAGTGAYSVYLSNEGYDVTAVELVEHNIKIFKSKNSNVKFLLENVKMKKEYENVITEKLGVEPMQINSECLSAQKRNRLYWFNWDVDMPTQTNNLVIKDILQPLADVEKEYYHKRTVEHIKSQGFIQGARMIQDENSKCECLLARDYKDPKSVVQDGVLRRLTPIEYERLQTLPNDYTSGVCKSHRYTAIGNGRPFRIRDVVFPKGRHQW
mgnify:CR=1 FL=1